MPKASETSQAVIEILDRERRYEIYADGHISGFSESAVIINRLPVMEAFVYSSNVQADCRPTSSCEDAREGDVVSGRDLTDDAANLAATAQMHTAAGEMVVDRVAFEARVGGTSDAALRLIDRVKPRSEP